MKITKTVGKLLKRLRSVFTSENTKHPGVLALWEENLKGVFETRPEELSAFLSLKGSRGFAYGLALLISGRRLDLLIDDMRALLNKDGHVLAVDGWVGFDKDFDRQAVESAVRRSFTADDPSQTLSQYEGEKDESVFAVGDLRHLIHAGLGRIRGDEFLHEHPLSDLGLSFCQMGDLPYILLWLALSGYYGDEDINIGTVPFADPEGSEHVQVYQARVRKGGIQLGTTVAADYSNLATSGSKWIFRYVTKPVPA